MNKQSKAQFKKQWEEQMEEQRMQVQEVELKARFWKAQFEIRYFTLEAEKIQPSYDAYVAAQQEKNTKAKAEYEEFIKKMQDAGAISVELPNEELPEEIATEQLNEPVGDIMDTINQI